LSRLLLTQADAYIVHSAAAKAALNKVNSKAPVLQRPHPIYTQFPEPNKKLQKRGRLELLFFGIVRPYKGLDLLVQALAQLQDKEVYLTVAGEAWGGIAALKQQLLATGAPNLELHFEYIDDATAANYFARADVVVLPYRSATGSGVLALAYHYGKPALATRVGGLADGVVDGKTGWLVAPDSPDALAQAIASIKRANLAAMEGPIKDFCKENSWDNMAREICAFAAKIAAAKTDS
jgi:glycosyltransferase involved in cell wall biosynthesis